MALPKTDRALVEAARSGEMDAWSPIMTQWLPTVLGWCVRLGGPTVDAEDAAQDVFIVAMDRIHSLREPDRFGSWMVGITRRVLSKHRRRGWVKRWVPGLEIPMTDTTGRGRWPELSETAQVVQASLESLSGKQREVLVLCDLEGHTQQEVADLLDVPLGTVKSRLLRARDRFRETAEFVSTPQLAATLGDGS